MSYDNTNSGTLFKNDRKEKDSHPDYKGSVNVEGVEYWLSSWIKKGAKGTFLSLALTKKDEKEKPKAQAKAEPVDGFEDDSIPF